MSLGTAEFEVRKSVWATLNADSDLTSTLGASIYQRVPDRANLPYVVLVSSFEVPLNTLGTIGRTVDLRLDCYSEKLDGDEVYLIASRVDELLDYMSGMTLTGYNVISISLDTKTTSTQPEYMRCQLAYEIKVEES